MPPTQLPGFDQVSRRTVLETVGLSTTLGGLARRVQPDTAGYVLEQGDTCVPIEPLSGDVPVEEFYEYSIRRRFASEENGGRDPGSGPYYSSIGTTHLQQPDTSLLFLYEGPDGTSLVVVHGRAGDRSSGGGSASFTISGLPPSGSWVVKDDRYRDQSTGELAATNYDRWSIEGTTHRIDWTWGAAATDGGAFAGLGSDPAVRIQPAFNEDATLWNRHYEGRVTGWQVLSGDPENPDRTTLDMAEAVTIRAGACEGQSGGDGGPGSGASGEPENGDRGSDRDEPSKGQDGANGEGTTGNDGNNEGKAGQDEEDETSTEHREEHREWNEEHRDLHRDWQEEHRELHREKDEEEADDWREEHAELHREWTEEHEEAHHEWQEDHRDLHRELENEGDDD